MPTVLITGGHAGLGLECVRHLAAGPRLNVLLAGRNLDQLDAVAKQVHLQYGVMVSTVKLDLSSLASVSEAAETCRAMMNHGQVDCLQAIVCNAGAQFHGPVSYTVDGYEETFAVNCLGHFLLVNLLVDRVMGNGRIVFVTSGTHDPDTMDGKSVGAAVEPDAQALAFAGTKGSRLISAGRRYSTSKLCTMLYAYELDRRLSRSHSSLESIAFDPGFIPETGLTRTAPAPVRRLARTAPVKWSLKQLGVTMGSLPFSGEALAKVVADPAFANSSGKYFQSKNGSLVEARSSKVSYDEERARRLWEDSRHLVHLPAERDQDLSADRALRASQTA